MFEEDCAGVFILDRTAFKYGLDDVPPLMEFILYSLQWLVISLPLVVIIARVAAGLQATSTSAQVLYLQKVLFVAAIALICQIIWGHRLPLVAGPSSVLLIGLAAGRASNVNALYSSILLGGVMLSLLGASGVLDRLMRLFTPRVVAVILLLIPFTLAPTVIGLIAPTGSTPGVGLFNFLFALILAPGMLVVNRFLSGIWKSTLVMWSILFMSLVYYLVFPLHAAVQPVGGLKATIPFFINTTRLTFDPAVLISFLLCFLALLINDLGSIQTTGDLLMSAGMQGRIGRGVALTGIANILSGFLGVIGPVDFSLSAGVVTSTLCASRYTLLPAGAVMLAASFSPAVMGLLGIIPSVAVGTILIYILCSQIAAGLLLVFNSPGGFQFEDALTVGLSLMLGVVVSFLPENFLNYFPANLRPLAGNGFVIGVLAVLILEYACRRKRPAGKGRCPGG